MQKSHGRLFAASCGLVLMGGCSFLKPADEPAASVVSPVSRVTHGAAPGDASYQLGRTYQGRMQYAAAIAAYRRSLAENPGNAEAHNALGVIYATLGRHDEAFTELKAALSLAPSAAHIHNNLGYAYLLAGRKVEAAAALEAARKLDPANERIRHNIESVEGHVGGHSPKLPVAVRAPAPAAARLPEAHSWQGTPFAGRLVSVAPNIFELRLPSAPRLQPLPAPRRSVAQPAAARLEVANGCGVTGLAWRTSKSLQAKGYTVARVTNQIPYVVAVTEIQFRPGAQEQARELNALLAVDAKLVPSSALVPAVGIRLVLGRDVGPQVVFNRTAQDAVAAAPAHTKPGLPAPAPRSAT